jgi:predicted AlkP superfamily pyrophosphatase or phosphodiesterase
VINTTSLETIKKGYLPNGFVKPQYDSYCFSNIPGTIEYALTAKNSLPMLPLDTLGNFAGTYDKVILFFIDAFGWRFFEKYQDKYPFLKRVIIDGVVSKLTSQFPSTTAAHVTTIHTGLPVGESGVYEWFYYEPKVDAIIAPLLFSFAGKKERNTLQSTGIDPKKIYPTKTFYQLLNKSNIKSYIFQHGEYNSSPYSQTVFKGATETHGYTTLSEALTNITSHLLNNKDKSYYFMYFDKIDSIAHQYGPSSLQCEAEINSFLHCMEELFYKKLAGKLKNTLFLMTADHGHMEINPETTIYINKIIPNLYERIKKNKMNELLVPAGSCRDMFLYIKEDYIDETITLLKEKLNGYAEIQKIENLISKNYFGDVKKLSKSFLNRVGNVVILPYGNNSIWWYEKEKFSQKYFGHHGGLTKQEMETILYKITFDR